MKRKLLVCGSAGFLMSNFIRYLLYRSKDFEIASVDRLASLTDAKRVYVHRDHKFYLGDVTDGHFMERLLYIEKPDMIINGIGYDEKGCDQFRHAADVTAAVRSLTQYDIPAVQLVQAPELDRLGIGRMIANVTFRKSDNALIQLPNCFGFRQKTDSGLAFLIGELLANRPFKLPCMATSWAYAEDVASLIWFVIENGITGEIRMPKLGSIGLKDIITILTEIFETKATIDDKSEEAYEDIDAFADKDSVWRAMMMEYNRTPEETAKKIEKWVPDSSNLKDAIIKTANWYKANRWAIGL
jgi:dTDP-D-glucose 4,6-dehydratase